MIQTTSTFSKSFGCKRFTPLVAILAVLSLAPKPANAIVYYSLNFKPDTTNYLWLGCVDSFGYLIANAQYSTTMNWVSNSNSHLHNTPGRPVSTLWPASGTVAANGQTQVTLYTTLIGQDEYVRISCSKPGYTTNPTNHYFTVGYPDIYYNNHPDRMENVGPTPGVHGGTDYNRYMTTFAATALYNTVGDYLALYSIQGQQVAANDQALPYGGIFDLNSNWWYPHNYHHRGTAADIRGNTLANTVPVSRQQDFINICYAKGADLYQVEYATPGDTDASVADSRRHIHCHWPLIP